MKNYRSAMGKTVDMQTLLAKNETTRAVGNMNVNARGDTIDGQGRVIKPVTEKVNDRYAKTVGNRSAQPTKTAQPGRAPAPQKPIIKEELNDLEKELESNFDEDLEIEKIKMKEIKK